MNELALAIRILMALVFLTAAAGKIRHRHAFQGVAANYRLMPEAAVPAFALVLPLIEAAIAGALVFAPPPRPEFGAAVLLLVFAAAMAVNLARGRRHIDCGCFQSTLKQSLSWTLVARNVALASMLTAAATVPEGTLSDWDAVTALTAGAALFILLQTLNILWSVVPSWRLRRAVTTGVEK